MKFICSLFAIFFCLMLHAEGRLLVQIAPNAPFTPQEFASAASAKLLEINLRNPHQAFEGIHLESPFVVLSSPLERVPLIKLAGRYGYRFAILEEETLEKSVERAQQLLASCPKYSSEFPALTVEEADGVYTLMQKIDRVFTQNHLKYWAAGGTLLGAIRHGGLIPWDDDLDLYILEKDEADLVRLRTALEQEGLMLHYYWKDLYKIYPKNGQPIPDRDNPGDVLPFLYPAADLFVMTLEKYHEQEDVYVHRSYDFYWHWAADRFDYSQIETLIRVPFGPLSIPIPMHPERYLDRVYGVSEAPDLWKRYAFEPQWIHKIEFHPTTPGSALVEVDDFSCASWKSH